MVDGECVPPPNPKSYVVECQTHDGKYILMRDRLFILYLENKGIVFKVRWFVRPDINTGTTII